MSIFMQIQAKTFTAYLQCFSRCAVKGYITQCRSFLGKLLPVLPHLRPMLAEGGASSERRMAFLRILRQLLLLDAPLVLSPAQQASRFLLDGYLTILNARSFASSVPGSFALPRMSTGGQSGVDCCGAVWSE